MHKMSNFQNKIQIFSLHASYTTHCLPNTMDLLNCRKGGCHSLDGGLRSSTALVMSASRCLVLNQ